MSVFFNNAVLKIDQIFAIPVITWINILISQKKKTNKIGLFSINILKGLST